MPAARKATKSAPKKPTARKAVSRKPVVRARHAPAARHARSSPVPAVPAAAILAGASVSAESSKASKPKKHKLVRDSFTIPKAEYEQIEALKKRAAKTGRHAKKSELLRAGLMALSAMGDAGLLAVLAKVPALKTGRPARA